MSAATPILVIGHITRVLSGGEEHLGGAANVARALSSRGMDVALVTSAPDDPLLEPVATDPRIRLHRIPSESFTTFDQHHIDGQGRLTVVKYAAKITAADIPSAWRGLPFVFLVPAIGECATELLTAFPESELIAGCQGWLRTVEADGLVRSSSPPEALLAARLLAVTLSEEDHHEAEALARGMAQHSRFVALTRGDRTVTIFEKSGENSVAIAAARPLHDINGAGQVFTALLGLRIIRGDTVNTAVSVATRGVADYVAGGMAGLETLSPADNDPSPGGRAKNCIRALIARSEVPEDPRHADNTLAWLLQLEPDSGEALQLAALAHDIDRATPERVRREDHPDYDAFKAAHARRGARLLRGSLEDCGVDSAVAEEACRLVVVHEVGGDPSSDLLKDADSISYFDVNLPLYFGREGWEETRRRCTWGYLRLSGRARAIVAGLKFAEPLGELMNESIEAAQNLPASDDADP